MKESSIHFIYCSIHEENSIAVCVLIMTHNSILTFVELWICNLELSLWFSLNHNMGWIKSIFFNEMVACYWMNVSVFKLSTLSRNSIPDLNEAFIRTNVLAIFRMNPINLPWSFLHLYKFFTRFIRRQVQFFINIINWVKNWKFKSKMFPLIIQLNESNICKFLIRDLF